jgi:SAM-dependent methyltransferase
LSHWTEREARRLSKAQILLKPAVEGLAGIWADLGCGDGIFTYLLAILLQPGSQIYAVDKNRRSLQALECNLLGLKLPVAIQPMLADFTRPLALPPLDGLVLANSLHFVKQKQPVLARLVDLLGPGGRLVLVEYNTGRGNYAVPHPLNETQFLALADAVGLQQAQIVSRAPSTFLGEMYTGLALAGASHQ